MFRNCGWKYRLFEFLKGVMMKFLEIKELKKFYVIDRGLFKFKRVIYVFNGISFEVE